MDWLDWLLLGAAWCAYAVALSCWQRRAMGGESPLLSTQQQIAEAEAESFESRGEGSQCAGE